MSDALRNAPPPERHLAALDRVLLDARSLLDKGRGLQAAEMLADACREYPGSSGAHYLYGVALADLGRYADALAAYDRAIQMEPANFKAHNNRGSALQLLNRMREAEDAFRMALRLEPAATPPYINLGYLLERGGRQADAVAVYKLAIANGQDRAVFGQHIAAVTAQEAPGRSPDAWVRTTFDNFAPTFDRTLRDLGYRVPEDLAAMVGQLRSPLQDVADLGCGTGLCGAAIASPRIRRLVGVDLAPRMIALARERNVYTELVEQEIHTWLAATPDGTFDLVIAADLFIYVGKLESLMAHAHRILRTGGTLAFSVERVDDDVDCVLRTTGRYAHSRAYIERLARNRFAILRAEATTLRHESGAPVSGLLYLLSNVSQQGTTSPPSP